MIFQNGESNIGDAGTKWKSPLKWLIRVIMNISRICIAGIPKGVPLVYNMSWFNFIFSNKSMDAIRNNISEYSINTDDTDQITHSLRL